MTKKLGIVDATLLVSGSMIGSGIFIVASDMSRMLGNATFVILAWVLTGIITLLAALSFGELASMMPNAGGQYNFITRIYGKRVGFVYGWSVFTVILTGVMAAVAMAFAKYMLVFFPEWQNYSFINFHLGDYLFSIGPTQAIAVAMILVLTYINSRGVDHGKWIQRIFTVAKLLALCLIIFGSIYLLIFAPKNSFLASNFESPFSVSTWNKTPLSWNSWKSIFDLDFLIIAFSSAMVGSLFSSDAWQGITFMSAEIKDPVKNIPKALFYGTTIVTVVYVLTNLAYFTLLPIKGITADTSNLILKNGVAFAEQDRVGISATAILMSTFNLGDGKLLGTYFMAILIMISTFGCNNGLILSGSRLYKAMADNGLFFQAASKLNSRLVPGNALKMQAFWASILCLSGSYGDLLNYCTFASLLFYIITVAGLILLRKKEPNADRPYKVFGYPYVPILYVIFASLICLGILISQWKIAASGIAIVLLGVPIYYFFDKSRKFNNPLQ